MFYFYTFKGFFRLKKNRISLDHKENVKDLALLFFLMNAIFILKLFSVLFQNDVLKLYFLIKQCY